MGEFDRDQKRFFYTLYAVIKNKLRKCSLRLSAWLENPQSTLSIKRSTAFRDNAKFPQTAHFIMSHNA